MTLSARVRCEIRRQLSTLSKFPRRLVRGADARAPRFERRETRERARPMDLIDRASLNSSAIARRARACDVNLSTLQTNLLERYAISSTD
jgi:hypothetical protein